MDSNKETEKLKYELLEVLGNMEDKQYRREETESEIFQSYALSSKTGKAVYESFTDRELLDYLRRLAADLDHAPSQKEIFWVLRDYIKRRFDKWPYALRAAGLSPSAGKGGRSMAETEADRRRKEELLQCVRNKAVALGKIPHPRDLPHICEELKRQYSTWSQVLSAAELDPQMLNRETVHRIDDLEETYVTMLESVKNHAYRLGRSPSRKEIDPDVKKALIARCGSWRNALYQIGLTPVVKIRPFHDIYIDHRKDENRKKHTEGLKGCVYQVLNLTEEEKLLLLDLKKEYTLSGRLPMKDEVDKNLRKKLIARCGTWINVLYQIGITPKEYMRAVKEKRR